MAVATLLCVPRGNCNSHFEKYGKYVFQNWVFQKNPSFMFRTGLICLLWVLNFVVNISFMFTKIHLVKDRWQSICGSCTAVASSCPWVPGTPSETLSASPECPEWSYRWYLNCYNVNPSHLQLLLQLCVPAAGVPGGDCQQHLHQTCEQCLTMESKIFGGGQIREALKKNYFIIDIRQ